MPFKTWNHKLPENLPQSTSEELPFYTIYDIFDPTGYVAEMNLQQQFRRMFSSKTCERSRAGVIDCLSPSTAAFEAASRTQEEKANEMFEGALLLPMKRLQLHLFIAAASAVPHCHILIVNEDGALATSDVAFSNHFSPRNAHNGGFWDHDRESNASTYFHLLVNLLCNTSAHAMGDNWRGNDLKSLLKMLLLPVQGEKDAFATTMSGIRVMNKKIYRAAEAISQCVPSRRLPSTNRPAGSRIFYFNVTPSTTLEQLCLFFYCVEFLVNSASVASFLAYYFPQYVTENHAFMYSAPNCATHSVHHEGQQSICHSHFYRIFCQSNRRMSHDENYLHSLQQCILTNYYLQGLMLPETTDMEVETSRFDVSHSNDDLVESSCNNNRAVVLLFNTHDASPQVSDGIARIITDRAPPLSEHSSRQTLLHQLDLFISSTLRSQKQPNGETLHQRCASSGVFSASSVESSSGSTPAPGSHFRAGSYPHRRHSRISSTNVFTPGQHTRTVSTDAMATNFMSQLSPRPGMRRQNSTGSAISVSEATHEVLENRHAATASNIGDESVQFFYNKFCDDERRKTRCIENEERANVHIPPLQLSGLTILSFCDDSKVFGQNKTVGVKQENEIQTADEGVAADADVRDYQLSTDKGLAPSLRSLFTVSLPFPLQPAMKAYDDQSSEQQSGSVSSGRQTSNIVTGNHEVRAGPLEQRTSSFFCPTRIPAQVINRDVYTQLTTMPTGASYSVDGINCSELTHRDMSLSLMTASIEIINKYLYADSPPTNGHPSSFIHHSSIAGGGISGMPLSVHPYYRRSKIEQRQASSDTINVNHPHAADTENTFVGTRSESRERLSPMGQSSHQLRRQSSGQRAPEQKGPFTTQSFGMLAENNEYLQVPIDSPLSRFLCPPKLLVNAISTVTLLSQQTIETYETEAAADQDSINQKILDYSSSLCGGEPRDLPSWSAFIKGTGGGHIPSATPVMLFQRQETGRNSTSRKVEGMGAETTKIDACRKPQSASQALQFLPHFFSPFLWGGAVPRNYGSKGIGLARNVYNFARRLIWPHEQPEDAIGTHSSRLALFGGSPSNNDAPKKTEVESKTPKSQSAAPFSPPLLLHLLQLPPPGMVPLDYYMLAGAIHFPVSSQRFLRQLISTICIRVGGPLGAGGVVCVDSAMFHGSATDDFTTTDSKKTHFSSSLYGVNYKDAFSNGLIMSSRSMSQQMHFISAVALLLSPQTPAVSTQNEICPSYSHVEKSESNVYDTSELIQLTDGAPSVTAAPRSQWQRSWSLFEFLTRTKQNMSTSSRSSGRVIVTCDIISCLAPFLLAHKLGGCGLRQSATAQHGIGRNELYNLYLGHMSDLSMTIDGPSTGYVSDIKQGQNLAAQHTRRCSHLSNYFDGGLWDAAVIAESIPEEATFASGVSKESQLNAVASYRGFHTLLQSMSLNASAANPPP